MRKLLVVTAREYLERVRTRWFFIATVFGPIVFGLLLFVPPWMASRSKASANLARIIVLDATGSNLGNRIAKELNGGLGGDTSLTEVRVVAPARLAEAESLATKQTVAKATRGYLVLDSNTMAGRSARYAGTNATSSADMDAIRRVVRDEVVAMRLEKAGLDAFQSAALANMRLDLDAERITDRGRGASAQVSVFFAFGVAMLLYLSILMYGQAVLRGVIEEKQTRVAEVVVASVSAVKLLGGKVLGVGAVGLTQIVIWIVVGFGLMKVRATVLGHFGIATTPMLIPDISVGSAILLIVFFVLGYTFYAALFAMVGATVTNEQDAQQAQMPVVMLLVVSAFALAPVLAAPESKLAYTMGWLPFSSPIIMPLRMSVVSLEPFDIITSLVILLCSCYIAVVLAARVYRTGLLMYGKRPAFREVVRWMRRAG
ncbi:MAG TPA: ABC transporter permease [Gemmatimonadaceae bacterium]|nr:ABC transporter permease [Gemmatimonadaceae bacterium]